MQVREILQRAGSWSMSLRPSTSSNKRDEVRSAVLNRDGFVCVFLAEPVIPSLATAVYTGVLMARDGVFNFSGVGLAGLLQTDNDLGKHITANVTTSSQSLSAWFDDLLPYGGLTKGTVTTAGLSNVAETQPMGLGLREMIDLVCAGAGAEWRVNPDGTIDAAVESTLYTSTPEVIVMRDPGSETPGGPLRGVNGFVDQLLEDGSQITTRAIGYGEGNGTQIEVATSTNSTVARGLDGNAVQIDRPIDLPSSSGTELSSLTSAAAAKYGAIRRVFSIQTQTPNIRQHVAPGDHVYVFDQLANITDTSNTVQFAGEVVFPLEVSVHEITWEVTEGMGVFLYRPNETQPWTDLSDDVVMGSPVASWRVGSDRGPGASVSSLGAKRFFVGPPPPVAPPASGGGFGGGGTRYGGSGYDRFLTSQEELDLFGSFGPGPRTVRDTVEQFGPGSNSTTRLPAPPPGSTVLGGP